MKKVLVILLICVLTSFFAIAIFLGIRSGSTNENISRIGIGGGGAFFNPM